MELIIDALFGAFRLDRGRAQGDVRRQDCQHSHLDQRAVLEQDLDQDETQPLLGELHNVEDPEQLSHYTTGGLKMVHGRTLGNPRGLCLALTRDFTLQLRNHVLTLRDLRLADNHERQVLARFDAIRRDRITLNRFRSFQKEQNMDGKEKPEDVAAYDYNYQSLRKPERKLENAMVNLGDIRRQAEEYRQENEKHIGAALEDLFHACGIIVPLDENKEVPVPERRFPSDFWKKPSGGEDLPTAESPGLRQVERDPKPASKSGQAGDSDRRRKFAKVYKLARRRHEKAEFELQEHYVNHDDLKKQFVSSRTNQPSAKVEEDFSHQWLSDGRRLSHKAVEAEKILRIALDEALSVPLAFSEMNTELMESSERQCKYGYDQSSEFDLRLAKKEQRGPIESWRQGVHGSPDQSRIIERLRLVTFPKHPRGENQAWDSISVRDTDKERRMIDVWQEKMDKLRTQLPPKGWGSWVTGRIPYKWRVQLGHFLRWLADPYRRRSFVVDEGKSCRVDGDKTVGKSLET